VATGSNPRIDGRSKVGRARQKRPNGKFGLLHFEEKDLVVQLEGADKSAALFRATPGGSKVLTFVIVR
jgi:hypothetical protein